MIEYKKNKPRMVVDAPMVVDKRGSRHGRYRDTAKRREYQRLWAAAKRKSLRMGRKT